jgi:geranylgeranyl pyrophosphate synthase
LNDNLLDLFERFLQTHLPMIKSFHPYFEKALGEMLDAGGKRFRPLLLLNVVKKCQPLLVPNAMHVALAVEMLHTYSLIHDDLPVMDNADLRRGHPTLHVSYDEVTAVLVGDALNTHCFNILANAPLSSDVKVELINVLSRDGGIDGMIIGQAIDCKFENKKLTLDELKFLHIHKTAKLIAASLLMGAIICELDEKTKKSLYDFGLNLGLLFQIQDDIIDVTQSKEEAGKTTLHDEDKNSFVTLLGLQGALQSKEELLQKVQIQLSCVDERLQESLQIIIDKYFKG